MTVAWDPMQYRKFADLRSRPFFDLVDRIDAHDPRRVVDLGCGPGELTAVLADRWPHAAVTGIDSSPKMISATDGRARVDFRVADLRDWRPDDSVDVVVSNAALQWVPEHRDLLRSWCAALPRGAYLAFQVPGNFTSPSHTLMRELADSPRWSARLRDILRHDHPVDDAVGYARLMHAAGWVADTWETTYVQVLDGPDPVLEWVRGTGLRPVLQALTEPDRTEFERQFAAALRSAYPPGPAGTLFPFRRVFAVGRKP